MNKDPDSINFSPADKATALAALASHKKGEPGHCPSPEELACLVDEKSTEEEKEIIFDHLASCRHCYEQWLTLNQISQHSSQAKIIPGPWVKIIKIGSPILAVAASVAIFLNIFSPLPTVTVMPPPKEISTLPSLNIPTKMADLAMMDETRQAPLSAPRKYSAKPLKREKPSQPNPRTLTQMTSMLESPTLPGAIPPEKIPAKTFVYTCNDNYEFVARIEGNVAWLFLPGNTIKTSLLPSGSGVKYTNESTIFQSKGEEALLETSENQSYECQNDRARAIWEHAKLNGVDFRAVGNEPGWELTLSRGKQLIFITGYGEKKYSWPMPEPMEDQQKKQTTYTAHAHGDNIEVLLEIGPCQDSMADIIYETKVTVTLNGRKYPGCGKALH